MNEQELKELKEFIAKEFPWAFPRYQATYSRGALNFTVRTSESADKAIGGLESMLREATNEVEEKPVYPRIRKVIAEQADLQKKTSTKGWQHPCPKCGGKTTYKEGTSKTGKPYKGWFCNTCDGVEWVREQ